jgi:hypothetical protein
VLDPEPFRAGGRTARPVIGAFVACNYTPIRSVPLAMRRIHPQCPDSDPSDHSVVVDLSLRREPAEEEDEEEDQGDGKKDDDDGRDDDGYSE